jgi:hypothetical protein
LRIWGTKGRILKQRIFSPFGRRGKAPNKGETSKTNGRLHSKKLEDRATSN